MKKGFIIIAAVCLGLVSCDNKTKQQNRASQQAPQDAEKAKQDSLAQLQEAEKMAKIAHDDSVAIYAWGDAKFGMTKKEVLRTKAFKSVVKSNDHFYLQYKQMEELKDALKLNSAPFVSIHFDEQTFNEVIRVHMHGVALWDYFYELNEDMNSLIQEFQKKYGDPSYLYEFISTLKYNDLDALKNGYAKRIAEWTIGSGNSENGIKTISISASKNSSTSYRYDCEITNSAFPKIHKEKTQKEIDDEIGRSKKAQEAVENAF